MSRWTDVDRLLLELSDLIDEFSELDERGLHNERWCGIMDSKGVIVNAPSIDLVRCKECKKAHLTYDGECKYCDEWTDDDGNYIEVYHDGNHYCSYGVRKENE